jgi:hypothetical protein
MKKKFDSVKFQREARKRLSAKYPASRTPELLRQLKNKFGHLQKQKALH